MARLRLFVFIVAVPLALLTPLPAAADFTDCQKLAVGSPIQISQPGVYCLVDDLDVGAGSGYAISVTSDGVTLDLNGHTVSNAGTPGTGIGVVLQGHRVEVRNGKVTGFETGLWSACREGDQGHRIERLHIDASAFTGAFLECPNSLFRNNLITRTGDGERSYAYGVFVGVSAVHVMDNSVFETKASTEAMAISAGSGSREVLVVGNRLTGADRGVYGFGGSGPRCRDNVTAQVAVPYSAVTNLGNNH